MAQDNNSFGFLEPQSDIGEIELQALIKALELINSYLCIFDFDGKILFMNRKMKSWLGFTDKQSSALQIVDLLTEPNHDKNLRNIQEYLDRDASERELSIRTPDGREMVVMAKASRLKQGDKIVGGILLLEDITERILIKNELLNSKHELMDIIESSPDATLVINREGKILHWNRAMVEITGYTAESMLGKDNYEHGWVLYNGNRRPMLIDLIVNPSLNISHMYTHLRREGDILISDNNLAYLKGEQKIMWGMAAPIYNSQGQVVGAIETIRDITERKREEEELQRSHDQLKVILESTVHALAITTEKRDQYTAGHQERVANLACAIAQEIGVSENIIENIKIAGTLHDIGKLYVPMDILNQTSQLGEIQRLLVMTHSAAGYDTIKEIPFSGPIAEIVLQHHERMDGSGYPKGLKGPDILIEARILAVADTFEAMSSHRPYRPALGIEKAMDEIQKNAGKLYDESIVAACVRLIKENRYQLQNNPFGIG